MTEEEEDSEAIKTELREAFRLYDKEGANNGNTYYIATYKIYVWRICAAIRILEFIGNFDILKV